MLEKEMLSWRTACGICGYFDFVQDERGVTLRQVDVFSGPPHRHHHHQHHHRYHYRQPSSFYSPLRYDDGGITGVTATDVRQFRQTNLDPLVALALCRPTSAPLVVADTSHTVGLSVLKWSDVSYRETSRIKSFTEYEPFVYKNRIKLQSFRPSFFFSHENFHYLK